MHNEVVMERVPTQLDNILTLSLVGLLTLALIIIIICKAVSKRKAALAITEAPAPVPAEVPAVTAPGSAGHIKLHDVPPKTAAMVMAIVADKMGKPLNELRFISIKEVK